MQDAELLAQKNALESENGSLKGVIEGLVAEKSALSQTVKDILDANINLKAGAFLLEKRIQTLTSQLQQKHEELNLVLQAKSAEASKSEPAPSEKKSKEKSA